MFLYNSNNPTVITSGSNRTWRFTLYSQDKKFFVGYDSNNYLFIKNLQTDTTIIDQRVMIGTIDNNDWQLHVAESIVESNTTIKRSVGDIIARSSDATYDYRTRVTKVTVVPNTYDNRYNTYAVVERYLRSSTNKNFTYLNGPHNLDLALKQYNNKTYLALARKQIGSGVVFYHNTIYRIDDSSTSVVFNENNQHTVVHVSGNNHETTAKIVKWKNGFSFLGFRSYETSNKPATIQSKAFEVIKNTRYTKMLLVSHSVDFTNSFGRIVTEDEKVGSVLGDLIYSNISGSQSWCRMNYEKRLGNLFINRNPFYEGIEESSTFSYSYLLRFRTKEGYSSGGSSSVKEYQTTCASLSGVYKINDDGQLQNIRPIQMFNFVRNKNSIPQESLFRSFTYDSWLDNVYTIWDNAATICFISGTSPTNYEKIFYNHKFSSYSSLGVNSSQKYTFFSGEPNWRWSVEGGDDDLYAGVNYYSPVKTITPQGPTRLTQFKAGWKDVKGHNGETYIAMQVREGSGSWVTIGTGRYSQRVGKDYGGSGADSYVVVNANHKVNGQFQYRMHAYTTGHMDTKEDHSQWVFYLQGTGDIFDYNYSNLGEISKAKLTYTNFPSTVNANVRFKNVIINSLVYIALFSTDNPNYMGFAIENELLSRSSQIYPEQDEIGLALTSNNASFNQKDLVLLDILHLNDTTVHAIFKDGNTSKIAYLENYEDDFFNISDFAAPSDVYIFNNRIFVSFDFATKKYPILFLRIQTNLSASDFPSSTIFAPLELRNVVDYFEGKSKNVYGYPEFVSELEIYNLEDNQSFKLGDIYLFNINHNVLGLGTKFKSQEIYFDLQPLETLDTEELRFVSTNFGMLNYEENKNLHFYTYIFNADNSNALVESVGYRYSETTGPLPGAISRKTTSSALEFDIIGLTPNVNYKIVVIPYSNQTNINDILDKTYTEIISSTLPYTELDFLTNYVPALSVADFEKDANDLVITLGNYSIDPYAKLKYTYYLSGKVWDETTFTLSAYEDTDIISVDFQGNDLSLLETYYNVNEDVITIKNLFYDEEPLLILNFEDTYNSILVYNNTRPDLPPPSNDLYIPIPFVYSDIFDPNQNFKKQGLAFHFDNNIKPNYADFSTTQVSPTFDSIDFAVRNYTIGDNAPLKDVGGTFPITYYLNNIVYYKIHLMEVPRGTEQPIDAVFNPIADYYQTITLSTNPGDYSKTKKSLIEFGKTINGREYSYYIEPILYIDRANDEINQMIWDILRTPTNPTINHYQDIVSLFSFKYFPNTAFSVTDVTESSLKLTLPTLSDALLLNPELTDSQVRDLKFRIQISEAVSGEDVYSQVYDIDDHKGLTKEIRNIEGNNSYEIIVSTCSAYNSELPFETPTAGEKITINTPPDSISIYEFRFEKYEVVAASESVDFYWSFTEPTETVDFTVNNLNFNTGQEDLVTIASITDNGAEKIVRLTSTNWEDIFEKCYVFDIARTNGLLASKSVRYIVGLPDVLTFDDNIVINETNTTSINMDITNISNNVPSFTRLLFYNVYNATTDSQYSWNPTGTEEQGRNNLNDVDIYSLKPYGSYKIKAIARWDNRDLFDVNFPGYLEKMPSSFYAFEYDLSTNAADFFTDAGKLISPSFKRVSPSGSNDLEMWFNYTGRGVWVRAGIDDGTGNIDLSKPIVEMELREGTFVSNYYGYFTGVPTTDFKILFEFYETDAFIVPVTGIEIPSYPSVTNIPRLHMDVFQGVQALKADGSFDNKFSFLAYVTPPEANFTVKCTGLVSGFEPNLRYVVYTEPRVNPNTNLTEDVKVVEFTLDNLTFGKTYSVAGQEIKVFADSSNDTLYLDSYPYPLLPFTCKYPLLKAPQLYEPNDIIKSKPDFRFYRVPDAFYYQCRVFYKGLDEGDIYDIEPIYSEKVRDFSETNYINFSVPLDVANVSGYYKLEVTTLNGDNAPVELPNEFSTSYTTITYLKDGVKTPRLRTLKDTSEIRPIFTFDFDDPAFEGRGDEVPEYIVLTSDPLLGLASDQTNAFGWYQYDITNFNAFISNTILQTGFNTLYYKSYNLATKRFSDVVSIDINYNSATGDSLFPNSIYTNSFYGVDVDGTNEIHEDPARVVEIDENFNFSKISYTITNEAGKIVSTDDNKTVFEVDERVERFYIYIDYNGEQLDDGVYYLDFYVHDRNGEERKLLKTSRIIINNRTLPVPKINYDSQAII